MSRAPYKYLDYYTFEDADLFFGREFEVQRMVGEILTSRLLVLFSPSGSGKTSLINAGVRPALEQLGHATAYVRFDKPPIPAVLDAVAKRLNAPLGENPEDLHAWFRNYYDHSEAQPTVVIFLDQFEEFFIIYRDQPEVREKFIAQLARLKYDAALPVYIVLSLREDYFVNLHEFRESVPSIFQNNANIRLRPFTENEARRAILEPAKAVGLRYEDGLADTLISDLQEQTPDKDGVAPIILQMVCHTLWQKRGASNAAITRKLYDQCGGAQTIIANRLTQALDRILKRDHGLMVKLFRSLKTPENLKRYRSLPDLQEALPKIEASRLQKLLDLLTHEEVLRHETRKGVSWYEFRHDYLVPQIAQWITQREERQQQQRMRYAIMPGVVLASILFLWAFIRFNMFEAHFEPHVDGQRRELVITRGFNPFDYKMTTGFFDDDVRDDSRTQNALADRTFVSMWRVTDWEKLIPLLKPDHAGVFLLRANRLESAKNFLISALKYPDWEVRSRAVFTLGALGKSDTRVINALVGALNYNDPNTRDLVTMALVSAGKNEPQVIEAVLAALKNQNSEVRNAAEFVLVSLGKNDNHVIESLFGALLDEDYHVRAHAALTLSALGKSDDLIIDILVLMLKDDDDNLRYRAASALVSLGKSNARIIEALVAKLKDRDSYVRSMAALALGSFGKSDALVIETLIAALKEFPHEVQARAVTVLIALGKNEGRVIEMLLAACKKQAPEVRFNAAAVLVALRKNDARVAEVLLDGIKSPESYVRSSAVIGIASLESKSLRVIKALEGALKDDDYAVRHQAELTFVGLGKNDDRVIDVLESALRDQDPNVRSRAALALVSLEKSNPAVLSALLATFRDDDSDVRSRAELAIVSLGKNDASIVEALQRELNDESFSVRSRAALSIASLGKVNAQVIQSLIAAFKDDDSDIQSRAKSALFALGKIDVWSAEDVLSVLNDQNPDVRYKAVESLGMLEKNQRTVTSALSIALKDQSATVRSRAAGVLVSLGKSDQLVVEILIAALKHPDSYVRSLSASSLGRFYKTESISKLLKLLSHHQSGYRTAAVEAIAAQDTISAVLEQAVKQKRDTASEPWTRLAAWEAYERIQRRRQQDRADSLARTQTDSIFARADSLFKAKDHTAAEEALSQAYKRLHKDDSDDEEGLHHVSHNDSLTLAKYKFAQARCQSLQKHLLPVLESLETAFQYDPTLKQKLTTELASNTDWAHIRHNWYLREVLLGQTKRAEGEE